jgi:hypothetical protein
VLTGERLFVHAGLTTPAEEIYSQPVPLVSRKVPGLPADFDAIVKKALALNPDDRFQTASEFQEALTRCAHRNGLLMAAPELAAELLETCGPTDQWRGEDEDDDVYAAREGTEVYNAIDEDEEEDAGPVSIHSIAAKESSRMVRPRTEVNKFAGLELTSIINVSDLEVEGAQPLVDLNVGPKLDTPRPLFELETRPQAAIPDLRDIQTVAGRPQRKSQAPLDAGGFKVPAQQALGPPALPPPVSQRPPASLPPPRPQPPVQVREPPKPGPARPVNRGATTLVRSMIRPWVVLVVILVAAGIAAGIVALSGPAVEVKRQK